MIGPEVKALMLQWNGRECDGLLLFPSALTEEEVRILQRAHDRDALTEDAVQTLRAHRMIVNLSPWLNHHSTCARLTMAGDCDCGLQKTLIYLEAVEQ